MNTTLPGINYELLKKSFQFLSSAVESGDLFDSDGVTLKGSYITGYFKQPVFIAWNILYEAFRLVAPDHIWIGGCNFQIAFKINDETIDGRPLDRDTQLNVKIFDDPCSSPEEFVCDDAKSFLDQVKEYLIDPLEKIMSS